MGNSLLDVLVFGRITGENAASYARDKARDCQKLPRYCQVTYVPLCPKPMCKKCVTHCYAPGYREKVRQVMRFSGMYLVKHGRLDLIVLFPLRLVRIFKFVPRQHFSSNLAADTSAS